MISHESIKMCERSLIFEYMWTCTLISHDVALLVDIQQAATYIDQPFKSLLLCNFSVLFDNKWKYFYANVSAFM